ncbi:6677_t:CDS:2 [Funneliformis geosporum]|uniref:6677_t:CDS:1 n=1 Tax=Funneliformis geosporum TaxID=1117311 RepID=A0A9W4T0R8_9GLOM|nr:6677_t:CDS:2 [Funneliformis geosporum]
MKDKSIQINSYKSTILMDLLEYTQHLIKSGDNSQRQQAHELQAIIQNSSVKNETQPNKLSYTPLILSGVLVVSLALIIGYLAFDLVNGTLDILMVICLTAIPIITIAGLILNYGFI